MFAPSRRRCVGVFSTFLANCVLHVAHITSIQSPFAVLLLGGAVLRCVSLPFTVCADRHLSRIASATPQLRIAWHRYDAVQRHPFVSSWEKKLAARKLLNERTRILHEHRTSNWQTSVYYMAGVAASAYLVSVPASQLGSFLIASASSTVGLVSPWAVALTSSSASSSASAAAVSSSSASWSLLSSVVASTAGSSSPSLSSSAVLCVVDPTLSLAIGLALYNVCQYLNNRLGFSAAMDRVVASYRHRACILYASAALLALVTPPVCSLLSVAWVLPSYLGPVCLGMAAVTAMKHRLGLQTAPGRALLRIESRPASHGLYYSSDPDDIDNLLPSERYDQLSDALLGLDHETRQTEWRQHKRLIEYECDTRLNSLLTRLGIFDALSEVTYEMDKTARKRRLAQARRVQARKEFWAAQGTEEANTAAENKPFTSGRLTDDGQSIWYKACDRLPPEAEKELERIRRENEAMSRNMSAAPSSPQGSAMAENCGAQFGSFGIGGGGGVGGVH